jgi:hypothetical protein
MSALLSPSTTQTIFASYLLILKTACFLTQCIFCVFIVTINGDNFPLKFTKPSTTFLCHTLKTSPLSYQLTVALTWPTYTRMENWQYLGSFNTVIKSGGTNVLCGVLSLPSYCTPYCLITTILLYSCTVLSLPFSCTPVLSYHYHPPVLLYCLITTIISQLILLSVLLILIF